MAQPGVVKSFAEIQKELAQSTGSTIPQAEQIQPYESAKPPEVPSKPIGETEKPVVIYRSHISVMPNDESEHKHIEPYLSRSIKGTIRRNKNGSKLYFVPDNVCDAFSINYVITNQGIQLLASYTMTSSIGKAIDRLAEKVDSGDDDAARRTVALNECLDLYKDTSDRLELRKSASGFTQIVADVIAVIDSRGFVEFIDI